MTVDEIREILQYVSYRDWKFETGLDGDHPWLRVRFEEDGELQLGRKWRLSPHMTRGEVVQTALLAVLTAQEHEVREHFRYCGAAIFGPHQNIDALLNVCRIGEDRRP